MKAVLKQLIPVKVYKLLEIIIYYFDGYAKKSYSQEGEDMILRRFLKGQTNGTYVDVGAHHPMRFSNTLYFYKQGWRGINIDPNPESMSLFKILRKQDINIQCGISTEKGKLAYIMFDDSALNTFDRKLASERVKKTPYSIVSESEVTIKPLSEILEQNLLIDQKIDFMTIDAEGFDLAVLKSNNWEKFRPKLILVEELEMHNRDHPELGNVENYLTMQGYQLCAKTLNTLFFKDMN